MQVGEFALAAVVSETSIPSGTGVPEVPGSLPMIGHVPHIIRDVFKFYGRAASMGPLVRVNIGTRTTYLISDHELLYQILVTDAASFKKGIEHERARDLVGNGILLSEGQFHRRQRLIMQPAFHYSTVGSYLGVMRDAAREATQGWRDGSEVALYDAFYELAVRVVIKSLFSTDMAEADIAEVTRSMPTVISGVEKRGAIPSKLVDLFPTRGNREFHAAIARLRALATRVLGDYQGRPIQPSDDLLWLLLDQQRSGNQEMTDEQINAEFMTFLTAGSETTPSAMAWTAYLLARHPEDQLRVVAELDEVVGDRPIQPDDIGKLTFLRAVAKESLRLYPPVWALGRESIEPVSLMGHEFPTGTQFFYSIYAVQRDPKVYDDPHAFRPQRWLGESGKKYARTAFLPFGAGKRNCIGEDFAWTEIQTTIGTIVRDWHLELATDQEVRPRAMGALVPKNLAVRVQRRRTSGAA